MMRTLTVIVACCLPIATYAGADEKDITYVDFGSQANQDLTANFGSGAKGNNLAEFPRGEQAFHGSKFKVGDRFLQLGSPLLAEPKPDVVAGILVDRPFARLHVLHSTLYGSGMAVVEDGTEIGRYRVNYEDGTSEAIPIVYGKDVRDWWSAPGGKGVTRGKIAWEGENDASKPSGGRIRVFVGTWENPHPKKKVESIDYLKVSEGGAEMPAAPFCLALTLEAGPK